MSAAPAVAKPRLASLDQFRGYTVAGMFLVNFLAAYHEWVPPVLLHHHNYCSYADTIMPQFLFAVGFAMRLSFGRHVQTEGLWGGYWRMVRRIVGLLLVAFAVYTEGQAAGSWRQLVDAGPWETLYPYWKRVWLQTLGQIALTSLWILPVIRSSARVRIVFMILSGGAHVALSHAFNYHWTNTSPNGVDGGPLGFMTWAIPAILGTLTCDAIVGAAGRPPLARLTLVAFLVMALGYVFSCGTRLYDLSHEQLAAMKAARNYQAEQAQALSRKIAEISGPIEAHETRLRSAEAQIDGLRRAHRNAVIDEEMKRPENAGRWRQEFIELADHRPYTKEEDERMKELIAQVEKLHAQDSEIARLKRERAALKKQQNRMLDVKLAPSPVVPPADSWKGRTLASLLAEPPFVQPPADDPRIDPEPHDMHRYWNYWMMTQRGGSLSYLTFGAGFSLLVYVLFYVLSDVWNVRIGVFRTLGVNALAGYVLAGMIGTAVKTFIPEDAPPWYVLTAFAFDFYLIWLFCRTLEKNRIFLRV